MELKLTPSGFLVLEDAENDSEPSDDRIRSAFCRSSAEGIFKIAACQMDTGSSLSFYYWKSFSELFIKSLCHQQEPFNPDSLIPLSEDKCSEMIMKLPPVPGGEYLNTSMLQKIWRDLVIFIKTSLESYHNLSDFLSKEAPSWHQVGRVCFHLAENKTPGADLPFAFLAAYTTGLNASGKPVYLPLNRALSQYAGENNRNALLKLLTPVNIACERCSWVREYADDGRIYHPQSWDTDMAWQFLLSASALEECGITIRVPDWWKKRHSPGVSVRIGETGKGHISASSLLDFDCIVCLGEQELTENELQELLSGKDGLVFFRGNWITVDRQKLKDAIRHWKNISKKYNGEISFLDAMRMLSGVSDGFASDFSEEDCSEIRAGKSLTEFISILKNPDQFSRNEVYSDFLRPYQIQGVRWLHFLSQLGLGACLADDMGLGKTVQILALLKKIREKGMSDPSLLIIPSSLLGNWKSEATKFAPELKITVLHPAETSKKTLKQAAEDPHFFSDSDLVITTYSMLIRQQWLNSLNWNLIILDEAQNIRNSGALQSKAVRKLSGNSRIALTGTPVENHLGDLWSLFDFINPGLLGNSASFSQFTAGMKKKKDGFTPLRKLTGPYILRRMKTDSRIITDLPDKSEVKSFCFLSPAQIRLYEKVLSDLGKSLNNSSGISRKGLILQTIQSLKQICNHPDHFTKASDFEPSASGKFLRLAEICSEISQRQEKVLIFTQFKEIIAPVHRFLTTVFKCAGLILHGETAVSKRQKLVSAFQKSDGPPFFVLSLKAGGTGLNLTEASHVIHFDRWWNPAVENQATDRAFRIGQKKNVLVHKFICRGTIEDRIDEMISAKKKLASDIIDDAKEMNITEMSDAELLKLFRLDLSKADADGGLK